MVKNTTGGSKAKGQARKFVTENSKASRFLRVSQEEGEVYGKVEKMLGNGMFTGHCIDDVPRLCHIRGKFSGRGKRDNIVEVGKWVLVGEREWDISTTADKSGKKLKADLLEVYSELDKEKLIDTIPMNWTILTSQEITKKIISSGDDGGADISFMTERDEECGKLMEEINANRTVAIGFNDKSESASTNDWIDDI